MIWIGSVLIGGTVTEFEGEEREDVLQQAIAVFKASDADDERVFVPMLRGGAPGIGYSSWLTKVGDTIIATKPAGGIPRIWK